MPLTFEPIRIAGCPADSMAKLESSFTDTLPTAFGFVLTDIDLNALRYTHDEPDSECHSSQRIKGALAPVCGSTRDLLYRWPALSTTVDQTCCLRSWKNYFIDH